MMSIAITDTHKHTYVNMYLQDLFIGLSDGVLQRSVPVSSLLHLPLGLLNLLSELPQSPPGSGKFPLILLHLALLLHLLCLQRQELERDSSV